MVDSGTKETGIATSSQVEFRIDNIQAGHISFLFYFYLFLFFIFYFLSGGHTGMHPSIWKAEEGESL